MREISWIKEAKRHIGLKENTSKSEHSKEIQSMLKAMGWFNGESKAWWNDDETPWCGLFVGYVLGVCDRYVVNEWYRAKSWISENMLELNSPAYGCIVVFTRAGGGHVGFVVGEDEKGNLMVIGGNQGNEVNIKPFNKERVAGYFWPSKIKAGHVFKMAPFSYRFSLPKVNSIHDLSTDES